MVDRMSCHCRITILEEAVTDPAALPAGAWTVLRHLLEKMARERPGRKVRERLWSPRRAETKASHPYSCFESCRRPRRWNWKRRTAVALARLPRKGQSP